MAMKRSPISLCCAGFGQVDVLLGLTLGLGALYLALQAWGLQRQWLHDRDQQQELLDRTPSLYRLLSRLTRQAGSRPLSFIQNQWLATAPYPALPTGNALTWVHARGIHDQAGLYPNCQNTRSWAKDPSQAPALIQDQFDWVDGQFKCKDTAQSNARWQGWVDQARSGTVHLAWQTGAGAYARWRWRAINDAGAGGQAIGVRLCLVMDSVLPVQTRPAPPLDCLDRPLIDQGRTWRVWTRAWSLRTGSP
jgi:hypothetical protein